MNINQAFVGSKVRTLHSFSGVPLGTVGLIVKDYGTGIMVAWDFPDRPLPNMTVREIAELYAINPMCPLRDGFDKATELDFLEAVI